MLGDRDMRVKMFFSKLLDNQIVSTIQTCIETLFMEPPSGCWGSKSSQNCMKYPPLWWFTFYRHFLGALSHVFFKLQEISGFAKKPFCYNHCCFTSERKAEWPLVFRNNGIYIQIGNLAGQAWMMSAYVLVVLGKKRFSLQVLDDR